MLVAALRASVYTSSLLFGTLQQLPAISTSVVSVPTSFTSFFGSTTAIGPDAKPSDPSFHPTASRELMAARGAISMMDFSAKHKKTHVSTLGLRVWPTWSFNMALSFAFMVHGVNRPFFVIKGLQHMRAFRGCAYHCDHVIMQQLAQLHALIAVVVISIKQFAHSLTKRAVRQSQDRLHIPKLDLFIDPAIRGGGCPDEWTI
jgi:hypothetical protein